MDRRDWFKNTIFGVVGAAIAKPAEAIPEPFVEPLMRTGGLVSGSGNLLFNSDTNKWIPESGNVFDFPHVYGT